MRVLRAPCVGRCDTAPIAEIGHYYVDHADPKAVAAAVKAHRHEPEVPSYIDLEAYRAAGGYELLGRIRAGEISREQVVDTIDKAGLRGCGGAGFPTARKWRSVLGVPGSRLMAVNADEGEPGTFKDRYFLETDPHRVLEGMLIGAFVVEASDIYFYLRDEYQASLAVLRQEIAKLEAAGLTEGVQVHIRRGAGAYICGEESAMIESIEGKRGLPRHKPPLPFQVGIFGRPTLINNVETLYWIRDLVERGPDWWMGQGRNGRKGLHTYSVSGRVVSPGVKTIPAGVTVRRADRRILRRHAARSSVQGLSSRRRVGRHPARLARRHSLGFRHAGAARGVHRVGGGRRPVGQGRHARGGAQRHALLRGRELRPVHPLPGRHGEGGQADGAEGLGQGPAGGTCRARCATPRSAVSARRRPTRFRASSSISRKRSASHSHARRRLQARKPKPAGKSPGKDS